MKYRYWMCPCITCRRLDLSGSLKDWLYSRATYNISSECWVSQLVILGFTWKTDACRDSISAEPNQTEGGSEK